MKHTFEAALAQLGSVTTLALEPCTISQAGIAGTGARLAAAEAGRGLVIALSRTMTSAAATVMPEEFAGSLVRQLGRWAQDNPDAWLGAIEEISTQDVTLTITVNHEILDDPREPPGGLWRAFGIECWARIPARTPEEITRSLITVASPALALALNGFLEDDEVTELPSVEPLPEGALTTVKVNRYERNPVNRLRCISHYGVECWACGLNFGELYGPPAAGYIEVHHRIPVSTMGDGYLVDPIRDLVPLCSNCHSAAHRRNPPYEPSEIRELLGLPPKSPPLPAIEDLKG
ncbi:5-methylcytosine-specific restriction protein A [Pseudarthrobacter sp. PvP004]|uniref:HNH endonuclease n=1 Tax=Pseudarthrobacter sp. PvP004 TaxID=2817850 RepID=UPI001AE94AF3|nr:HNH endonuclease [Pseudarthrobacter sp. PvP004]MBP2267044.1 5-methylcytosine-specific restriction protein A [Pseudarthrobacter sp. PvP004]